MSSRQNLPHKFVFRAAYRSLVKMTRRNLFAVSIIFLLGPVITFADGSLSVSADLAQVSIAPRPQGRSLVRLPSIEFSFSINAECQNDWTADSVSLSIADTQTNLNAQQIESETAGEIKVVVPQKQIAPLALADFCSDRSTASTRRGDVDQLVVRDVLSFQASLLCASDDGKKMTYISHPLDILLTCEQPDDTHSPDSSINL